MGKPKTACRGRGVRNFIALETMANVQFELYIATLRGNGAEAEKVFVEFGKGRGMTHSPMDPCGNLPTKAGPNEAEVFGCSSVVRTVEGGKWLLLAPESV